MKTTKIPSNKMQLTKLSMQDEDNEKYKHSKQQNAANQTVGKTPKM